MALPDSPLFDEALDPQAGPKKPTFGASRMLRVGLRPWVVGAALIAFGACCHIAFRADPLPGRHEMGRFACLELLLYPAGLGLGFISFVSTSMSGGRRAAWLILWLAVAAVALGAIVDSLPS